MSPRPRPRPRRRSSSTLPSSRAFEVAEPVGLAAVPDLQPVDLHVVAPFHDGAVGARGLPSASPPSRCPSLRRRPTPSRRARSRLRPSPRRPPSPRFRSTRPPRSSREPARRSRSAAPGRARARRRELRRAGSRRRPRAVAPGTSRAVAAEVRRSRSPPSCRPGRSPPRLCLGRNARPRPRRALACRSRPSARARATAVVIHPPVAAADLPPLADAPRRRPLLEEELSFSRKPKERSRKPRGSEGSEGRARAEAEVRVDAVLEEADRAGSLQLPSPRSPSWRTHPLETEVLTAAPKVPFWKKQVSLGRKQGPDRGCRRGRDRRASVRQAAAVLEEALRSPCPPSPCRRAPRRRQEGRARGQEARRPQDRRLAAHGRARLEQRRRRAPPDRPQPLEPGIVVAGELRDPDALGARSRHSSGSTSSRRRACASASRTTASAFASSTSAASRTSSSGTPSTSARRTRSISVDEAVLDFHVVGERSTRRARPRSGSFSSPTATSSSATWPRSERPA